MPGVSPGNGPYLGPQVTACCQVAWDPPSSGAARCTREPDSWGCQKCSQLPLACRGPHPGCHRQRPRFWGLSGAVTCRYFQSCITHRFLPPAPCAASLLPGACVHMCVHVHVCTSAPVCVPVCTRVSVPCMCAGGYMGTQEG